MSLGEPISSFDRRVCPKCGSIQESPGSTFCEQCGATLPRLGVVPERAQPRIRRPGRALGTVASVLIGGPSRLVRSGVGVVLLLGSLVVRGLALVLVLAALVTGLSLVPQVRTVAPPIKDAAMVVLTWLQRAGDVSAKLQVHLAEVPQPVRRTAPTGATAQRPAPSQAAPTQALTVVSTPSGATVQLDARTVGKTPVTIKLAPGVHKVTVSRSGYASVTRTVTVKSGQAASLSIALATAR